MQTRNWIFFIVALVFYTIACNTSQQSTTDAAESNTDSLLRFTEIKEVIPQYPTNKVSKHLAIKLKNDPRYKQIKHLYSLNNNMPFFTDKSLVIQGLTLLRNSQYHGFNPALYQYAKIDSLFAIWDNDFENDTIAIAIELLLTTGIHNLATHLSNGVLKPSEYYFSWNFNERTFANKDSIIFSKFTTGTIDQIEAVFEPKTSDYRALKECLKYHYNLPAYKKLNIKYPGFVMHKGDSNKFVSEIKQVLKNKGYYSNNDDMFFNMALHEAIKKFQKAHNLNNDGVPGKLTYQFLNWTNERYIDALKINLERLRWLPDSIENSGVLVNIPAGVLQAYTNNGTIFTTRVIVGKYKNQTPVLQSEIEYLVFNPCWTVPNSIATKKMLPKIKNDSNYLKNRNMFIGLNGKEQDISSINFDHLNKDNFPYKIYQRNGSGNALGEVKFMFYNSYSIYLHDTPSKSLFKKDIRTLSHGCIRVQNAMSFANILLYQFNKNTRLMKYYLSKGYPEIVNLDYRVPLNMVYLTCFKNKETSKVVFCKDVYAKDVKELIDFEKFNKLSLNKN